MTEKIWLISIASEYEEATPLTARRTLESAKQRCDEHRKLHVTEDYSVGPITWGTERNSELLGEAVVTYTYHGKQQTAKQIYVLEELNLDD